MYKTLLLYAYKACIEISICTFSKTPKGLTILRNGEIWQTVTHCCPLILWEISVKNFGKHAGNTSSTSHELAWSTPKQEWVWERWKREWYAICSTNGQIYFCCGRTNMQSLVWTGQWHQASFQEGERWKTSTVVSDLLHVHWQFWLWHKKIT